MFGFICLLFILAVRAPRQTWAGLTSCHSPEHKTNKDPPQVQRTLTKRSKHCLFCFFSSNLFLNSSYAQRLLEGQKAAATFGCPPFFPPALVLIHRLVSGAFLTPRGSLCIACEGQCLHLSVPNTPGAPFPPQLDPWTHLTPLFPQMTSLYPKGSGQTRRTGSLSPFHNIPPVCKGVKYTLIYNYG